ncbi:unnamed protein product [Vitrella brassicaformis CCMP3155]|uniref:Phosphatidate cytidylyltransferase n=1 Tax=Vitrella brassicaformis (strain CCMP3155) TaxID=1169540 RepID=A0A0G4EIK6_VITBC|nr:unnamed protein product [Vitrella brassicaformis CCMP3155]|eukprot:CEL95816.1 unnamed protein product [Vitrella brassicaformis CCMP3155]
MLSSMAENPLLGVADIVRLPRMFRIMAVYFIVYAFISGLVTVTRRIHQGVEWYLSYVKWLWDGKNIPPNDKRPQLLMLDIAGNGQDAHRTMAAAAGEGARDPAAGHEDQGSKSAQTQPAQPAAISPKMRGPPVSLAQRLSTVKKRVLTGVGLGLFGTAWVFSGNALFTMIIILQCIVAQLEYYRMCIFKGIYPARRISMVSSLILYTMACYAPQYHELVLPLSGTAIMVWFLLMRPSPGTISEISTSFMGLFWCSYLPSFWIRLRFLGPVEKTRFVALLNLRKWYPPWLPKITPPPDLWTQGAVVTWWTFLSIAMGDVAAYFLGKSFGRRKLASISPAAGAASPNKTVEGALGGLLMSVLMSLLGAWLMHWPIWPFTGALYGTMLAVVGLVGDLTASTFKRDAGLKDSGHILPGHGGLLDRVDSYMLTATPSLIFVQYLLPALRKIVA